MTDCRTRSKKIHCIVIPIGITLAIGALLTLSFGYIVPMIQYSNYVFTTCKVNSNRILSGGSGGYTGYATLNHIEITREIIVVYSKFESYVSNYLSGNFKVGSTVQCFVCTGTDCNNGSNIFVNHLVSPIGVIFTIILAVSACLFFIVSIITCIANRVGKRSQYIDLDIIKT